MAFRSWTGIALGCLLGACGGSEPSQPEPEVTPAAEVEALDHESYAFGLETSDHRLYPLADTSPRLYTVTAKDGRVLARGIDDARLLRDFPELHELVHGGVDAIGIGDDY